MWQAIDGEFWPVPDTTDIVPWGAGEQDKTVFYRFIGEKWATEKKPTCAEDLSWSIEKIPKPTQEEKL